VSTDVWRPVLC